MEGNRVTGVRTVDKRGKADTFSGGTVILCSGAISSPQLLQLSGIGDPDDMAKHGVKVRHELPGVGKNLQDHLEVYVQYACKKPVSMNPKIKWYNHPWTGLQWLFAKKGPAATNHFEAGGFLRSNDQVKYPNLMFHFLPLAVRYDGSAPAGGHGYQVHIGPMYSNSRGHVKIRSRDPKEKPALLYIYMLEHPSHHQHTMRKLVYSLYKNGCCQLAISMVSTITS